MLCKIMNIGCFSYKYSLIKKFKYFWNINFKISEQYIL